MYEIWLVINTIYELVLANQGLVLGIVLPWLALMLFTQFKKHVRWLQALKPTLLIAVVSWLVFFALVPSLTKSSFASVNSVIDWLTVAGVAAGLAGVVAIFAGPIYLLTQHQADV